MSGQSNKQNTSGDGKVFVSMLLDDSIENDSVENDERLTKNLWKDYCNYLVSVGSKLPFSQAQNLGFPCKQVDQKKE